MNTDIVRKVSACFAALRGCTCCTVIFLVLGTPSPGFGLTLVDNVLLRETYPFANETQWFGAPAGVALFAQKNNTTIVVLNDRGLCLAFHCSEDSDPCAVQTKTQLSPNSRQHRSLVKNENCFYVASDSGEEGGNIGSFSWEQGQLTTGPQVTFAGVSSLEVSPDGKWLAACSLLMGELRIYQQEKNCQTGSFQRFGGQNHYLFRQGCSSARFSKDSTQLCVSWASDNQIACFKQSAGDWRPVTVLTPAIGDAVIDQPVGAIFADAHLLVIHRGGELVLCPLEVANQFTGTGPAHYSYQTLGCRLHSHQCQTAPGKPTLTQPVCSFGACENAIFSSNGEGVENTIESSWPDLGELDEIRQYDNKTFLIAGELGLHVVQLGNGSLCYQTTLTSRDGSAGWPGNRITFDFSGDLLVFGNRFDHSVHLMRIHQAAQPLESFSPPLVASVMPLLTTLFNAVVILRCW
ncbi:WD40 repeat domain-containing protein [Endozoicomonas sp. 4G]|uniref:WD40 repeat domain-containing protein n=1 Tax=Endozoicomonas sp. 4G TaxID=2872754 RepID=UPI002079188D|nr:WD40 repeat domain-containing protein [Endozoicomonas sp. 4G]